MSTKKKISVIALDPRAGESYKSDIEKLFADVAEVSAFSMLDGSAAGVLDRADRTASDALCQRAHLHYAQKDTSRSRAHIQNAQAFAPFHITHLRAYYLNHLFHQRLRILTRDQHMLVHIEGVSHELLLPRNVLQGNPPAPHLNIFKVLLRLPFLQDPPRIAVIRRPADTGRIF